MDRPDWIFGRCVSCCCGLFYKLQPFIFLGVYVISICTYLEPVNLFWSYLTLPNGFRCTLDIRYFLYYAWLHRKSGWKFQDEHLASSCKKWTSIWAWDDHFPLSRWSNGLRDWVLTDKFRQRLRCSLVFLVRVDFNPCFLMIYLFRVAINMTSKSHFIVDLSFMIHDSYPSCSHHLCIQHPLWSQKRWKPLAHHRTSLKSTCFSDVEHLDDFGARCWRVSVFFCKVNCDVRSVQGGAILEACAMTCRLRLALAMISLFQWK